MVSNHRREPGMRQPQSFWRAICRSYMYPYVGHRQPAWPKLGHGVCQTAFTFAHIWQPWNRLCLSRTSSRMSISIHLRLNLANVIINITEILSQGMYCKIKRVFLNAGNKSERFAYFKRCSRKHQIQTNFQHFTVNNGYLLVYFHKQNNFR